MISATRDSMQFSILADGIPSARCVLTSDVTLVHACSFRLQHKFSLSVQMEMIAYSFGHDAEMETQSRKLPF